MTVNLGDEVAAAAQIIERFVGQVGELRHRFSRTGVDACLVEIGGIGDACEGFDL